MNGTQSFQLSPVNLGNRAVVEPIVQPLYDNGTVATSATTQIQFFKVPVGQSSKTYVNTNLDQAGVLANPKIFVVLGFRLHLQAVTMAATNIVDALKVIHSSYFSFDLGGNFKNYLRVPAFMLPSGFGITGFSDQGGLTGATAAMSVTNGQPNIFNYFSIAKYPIGLPPLQSFEATLNFPTAQTLTTATVVWAILWGILGREVG